LLSYSKIFQNFTETKGVLLYTQNPICITPAFFFNNHLNIILPQNERKIVKCKQITESWSSGNFDKRFSFTSGLIAYVEQTARDRKEESKNKLEFTSYYVVGVYGTGNEMYELCFKELFSTKNRFLDRVVSKKNLNLSVTSIPGKSEKDAFPNDLLNLLSIFLKVPISSCPAHESRNNKKDTAAKFFSVGLNLIMLYSTFERKMDCHKSGSLFYNIFHAMNWSFVSSSVDNSSTFDSTEIKLRNKGWIKVVATLL
jgi:hypothetical protein